MRCAAPLFVLAHATVQMKMTTSVIHLVSRDRYRMLSKRSRRECYQTVKTQSSARCVASEHLRRAFLGQRQAFAFGQVAHATVGAPKILSRPASATASNCAGLDQDSFSDQLSKSMMRLTPETARASRAIASLSCEVEARDADAGANCQNIRRRFFAPRLPVRPRLSPSLSSVFALTPKLTWL